MAALGVSFSEKVIIVTGGSRGIGRGIVEAFAESDGTVVILDLDESSARQTVSELISGGRKVSFLPLDVSSYQGVQSCVEKIIQQFGKIDVLVNDAGVSSGKPFAECDETDWEFIVGVNLKGTFNTCNAVFPHMIENKSGKIVNIASIAGKLGGGFRGTAIYAASKAGVIGLTKGLAREGGPFNINCNAICPGVINTTMIDPIPEEHKQAILASTPIGRFGEPREIGDVAMFLASEMASHVTGEIFDVDGGIMRD